ncbi:MAG: DinB family protein [Acidobacteriota bacterium]|nr:DinB family protein [Acidobacteriota bacterium]
MKSIESLRQLFTYNEWANRRVFDSFGNESNRSHAAVRAFAHLLVAEKMWLVRLLRNEDTTGFDFWQPSTLEECAALAEETRRAYAELLENLTEETLDSLATYKNSKGIEYRTSFYDILTHVLFHSTYHRGQVAMAVRNDGGEPAYTDYIAFVRESEK